MNDQRKLSDRVKPAVDRGVDDPTDRHDSVFDAAGNESRRADPTLPDRAPITEEFVFADAGVVDVELSVMQREFVDALDGDRDLGVVASVLAITPGAAKRVAEALIARGVIKRVDR